MPEFSSSTERFFGRLTLEDLSNRSDKAYTDLQASYTASSVLYRLYGAETLDDTELREALDLVLARLCAYRDDTRAAWRAAHRTWARAAGVPVTPDDTDSPEETSTGEVSEDIDPENTEGINA
ncbi:hypothetical protein [Frankia sp. Cj5]|uniref:hypothetical protein n=1 Tax=Frankia sp. Cj5 TaxID=2880978 RepID=UPI001EF69125|nr:hypothetical protein [Frankia sp. Cj5]